MIVKSIKGENGLVLTKRYKSLYSLDLGKGYSAVLFNTPNDDYIVVDPYKYIDADGKEVEVSGYIQGVDEPYKTINHSFQTVIATPAQTAYMTVQGEWAVYYNRAGKIVGIELFDGQF